MDGQKSFDDFAQDSRSPEHSEHGNVAFQGACQRREDVRRAGLALFADSAEEGVHARLSLFFCVSVCPCPCPCLCIYCCLCQTRYSELAPV